MKRTAALLAAILLAFALCACGADEGEENMRYANLTEMQSAEEVAAQASQDALQGGNDIAKRATPFYTSQIQYNEGFFLCEDANGDTGDVQLLFPVEKMLEVRSFDLRTVYREGTDYEIADGKLRLLPDSGMRSMPLSEFFLADDAAADFIYNANAGEYAGKKPNTDKAALYPYRYAATYIRTQTYDGYVPATKGKTLSRYAQKAQSGGPVEILYVGDSIGTGAGASGETDKLTDLLEKAFPVLAGARAYVRNASVGGLNAAEYSKVIDKQYASLREEFRRSAEAAGQTVERYAPKADVICIAFGANDCAGHVSDAVFSLQVGMIVDRFRAVNPDVSIVAVASMDISPKVNKSAEKGGAPLNNYDMEKYANALTDMEKEYTDFACADVYHVQKSLLKRKQWEDLIADNLNHPCDYMQQIYVQTILATLAL